jgi:hypothetical protein
MLPIVAHPPVYRNSSAQHILTAMDLNASAKAKEPHEEPRPTKADISELIPLFHILVKSPPPDHDPETCPVCKEYELTRI